jgi:hypothetical protein
MDYRTHLFSRPENAVATISISGNARIPLIDLLEFGQNFFSMELLQGQKPNQRAAP